MKNKNVSNVIFIISMLVVIGVSVEITIVRNLFVSGVMSAFVVGVLYAAAATLLIAAARIKKLRIVAWICRIVVAGFLAFVFISSFPSVNEDAVVVAIIYAAATISAIISGILRHKVQTEQK